MSDCEDDNYFHYEIPYGHSGLARKSSSGENFFKHYDQQLFTAKQSWKQRPDFILTCEFCKARFVAGRSDKKTCSTECRRRKSAGEQPEICVRCQKPIAKCEPFLLEGLKVCEVCDWQLKHETSVARILRESGGARSNFDFNTFSQMIRKLREE